ncbi:MAG: serine/threonine protein kinase [Phycisphaerales bacterium]|jgi:eukaryotic-like serine/threonine-protein kinase|nr:serine/threonine protein kinase [Phycisphaerales bacterium]
MQNEPDAKANANENATPQAKPNPSMETELGKLIVEQGLATQIELRACLDAVQSPDNTGDPNMTLLQVLVKKGVVTASQIGRVKKAIEATRGQEIPGYQLLAKIGAGAMAMVFKAKQISLDRIVAIKVLPRKLSENVEYVTMFYKEGKAAAKLNHANIVQAFDVGEAGGFHYFVMEFIEGHDLWDELQADGKYAKNFTEADALDVIIQIARALEHAHSHGLIHRDVKPKNIMLTMDGDTPIAKLADMGLARSTEDVDSAKAEAGRAYGTPYYISPEQIRGEVDIDFRADIYSLGATFYHVVTGRVPFDAETPVAVMRKHLSEPLIPPDHLNTALSAGVGEVIEVMMAKDRNARYSSTSDLLMDLEAIAQGRPPMQARKQIDAGVLSGLSASTAEESVEDSAEPVAEIQGNSDLMVYIIMLGAALAVSILFNVIQLIM